MTDNEFRDWMKIHSAAFPGLLDWLKRQGAEGSADITTAWKSCLSDVSKEHALKATDMLNRGDEAAPNGFGDHARAVRKVAIRLKGESVSPRNVEYIDGNRVVNCHHCNDTGWVVVANIWVGATGKAPIKPFLDGTHNRLPVCGISCSCAMGPIFSATERRYRLPKFDSRMMFAVDGLASDEVNAAEFRQWWAEGHRHGNRVAAFDAFNAGATS